MNRERQARPQRIRDFTTRPPPFHGPPGTGASVPGPERATALGNPRGYTSASNMTRL
ncbi:glutathione s-transferase protein [Ralstonia solanacearum SD54]|nr:hypothetical protein F504_2644 [Ralstonia pseudosolanacearum FQY_4]ANH32028.1 hypothetical protein A3768_0855 [Ralstonia solanacearum]ARU20555.1 thiamine monophosphate kinase [Ralstonia solanacearum]ESS49190.1 glutathione s-transferase protein [Ralstonia solanacearum SD54]